MRVKLSWSKLLCFRQLSESRFLLVFFLYTEDINLQTFVMI